MAAGPVRDLLVALDHAETAGVTGAVERLGRYGHTSGMDCALGVVLGLLGPTTGTTQPLRSRSLARPCSGP